jgi:aminopeptidase N
MFKHPSPADFFRTMEDASGIDLDWFWRGWFYTTDVTDIGVKGVKKYTTKEQGNTVEFVEDSSAGLGFANTNDKYHYEITYEKPGGLVMPIIVEFTYKDGTTEKKTYPAQIWRYNDKEVTKVFTSSKQIESIMIDPDLETADVDTSNNSFPRETSNKFDKFKQKMKG